MLGYVKGSRIANKGDLPGSPATIEKLFITREMPQCLPFIFIKGGRSSLTNGGKRMRAENKLIRTAAYCRVSTDKEAQEGSYEMQEIYFTDLIKSDPGMEFVGIYGDKGRSGLKMAGRPGLQKLLEDCRAGQIDLILTKSISRFARSMSDCAAMIRELRSIGIDILFEKENMNSRNKNCDLILHIFSAIAQEESRSISQHSIRSHEQYVLAGKPSPENECGCQRQFHRTSEDRKMRSDQREHFQTRHHQRPALAQQQMGVFHRSLRPWPDPGAEDRNRGDPGIRSIRG